MAAFTANDACMKAVSDELPLMQALTVRGLATTALLAAALAITRPELRGLGRRDWRIIGVRTLAEVGAAYFFLTALFAAPLANVTAILQALPLTVTLAAAVFLGEPVGVRRWGAIALGFAGMLLIVRPGPAGFDAAALNAIIAVGFVTIRDLATRRMSSRLPSLLVALAAAAGVTLFAALGSIAVDWQRVGAVEAGQLAGASVFVIGGYVFVVLAVRTGDTGAVAPFRYTSLVWALLLGWAVFGEWPANATLAGAAVIVAAGLYTFYRERRVDRSAPVPLRIR
jgi:S-adenosylmethionine uptake transporter